MEYQAKLYESRHPFYIIFQVLKVLIINPFIMQPPGLLTLIVLHQFLHQQMLFFTTFKNFMQHILKEDFLMNIRLINEFTLYRPKHKGKV